MAKYQTEQIRNLALIGHGDAGKTTLLEAMLHLSGITNRMGSVDDGTSIADVEEEEKDRKITIDPSMFRFTHSGKEMTIIDTPGYPEFIAGVVSATRAVDTAVLVIAATDGIQVNTRRVWRLAETESLAKAIVITKMDGENIDLDALLGSIQEALGSQCIPLLYPVGHGADFKGVVNVFSPKDVPAEVADTVAELGGRLRESIVEVDDALMERYLEEQEITDEEYQAAFVKALAKGTVVPILCCSPRKELGVKEVLDALADITPSPIDAVLRKTAPQAEDEEGDELQPDAAAPFVGQVFKVMTDPFVGKITYFRVFSGTVSGSAPIYNARTKKTERPGDFFHAFGREQKNITEAIPGDIVGVAKLDTARISDTFCDQGKSAILPEIVFPTPMASLAVQPKSRGDEQKIGTGLNKLGEEDATFKIVRDRRTSELVISGMSILHLDVMIKRLKRRFDVDVSSKAPKIAYMETITAKAEGHHKHKKQSGGRGQFGEVYLRVAPTERGAGFEFVDKIVGGSIPNQYIPAVEKGIKEIMAAGILADSEVVDLSVELYDGSFHNVDSSEAAFKLAGSRAFQEAFMNAKPVLLEPVVAIEVSVPPAIMGDINGDLNGRRGRIIGVDSIGGMQVIKATVPMSEVSNYATDLRSITGGQGSYTLEFSHYDVVPARTAEAAIEKVKKEKEEKEK